MLVSKITTAYYANHCKFAKKDINDIERIAAFYLLHAVAILESILKGTITYFFK